MLSLGTDSFVCQSTGLSTAEVYSKLKLVCLFLQKNKTHTDAATISILKKIIIYRPKFIKK